MAMKIETLKDLKHAYKNPYVHPGCYPNYMIMADGGTLCRKCIRDEYRELVEALKDGAEKQWLPVYFETNWESEIYCDHCNEQIESAYGVPDDNKPVQQIQSDAYDRGGDMCYKDYCDGMSYDEMSTKGETIESKWERRGYIDQIENIRNFNQD